MKKCKDCNKEIQDPSFNCNDCLKEIATNYDKRCPICGKKYEHSILGTNGHWTCITCGELYYKPNSRREIEKLLQDTRAREIIKKYVQMETNRTHKSVDISPSIIKKQILNH